MLLKIEAIKETALEIYKESLKDRRIDEDMTSDIYYLFIKRMTAFKNRHPQKNEVTSAFVKGAVKFIIRDLRKRNQKQETREEELYIITQNMFAYCEHIDDVTEYDDRLEKLFIFIKEFTLQDTVYIDYVRFFLLYYSFYLPVNFIQYVCEQINLDFLLMKTLIPAIRDEVIKIASGKKMVNDYSLSRILFSILFYHGDMNSLETRDTKNEQEDRLKLLKLKQKEAVDAYHKLEFLPTIIQTSLLCGVKKERFRYGLKLFTLRLREYFKPWLKIYKESA